MEYIKLLNKVLKHFGQYKYLEVTIKWDRKDDLIKEIGRNITKALN